MALHIMLIVSQPIFALTPLHIMLSREAVNTNSVVCGLIPPEFEPTIYCIQDGHSNYYTTNAVLKCWVGLQIDNFLVT